MTAPTREQAGAIYDVLIEHAGASPSGRETFVECQARNRSERVFGTEYRFIGSLGFGGKFRDGSTGRWYVDYYPEDKTPERERARIATNEALSALQGGTQ